MKLNLKLSLALCLVSILIISGCGDDGDGGGDPQPQGAMADEVLEANAWNLESVTSSASGDLTSDFAGLTVSFSNGNYTASNTAYGVLEASGTYTLSDVTESGLFISLSNGNNGTAQINGEKINMQITVTNTIFGGGRLSSLAGSYQFVLTK